MKLRRYFIPLIAASAWVPMARADFDVSPTDSGGTILTNAISDATGVYVPNVRVFDFAFDDPSTPFFTQDPGFHTPVPSGCPSGVGVTVAPVGALQYWSGSGSPSFGAVPSGEVLHLAFGSTSATVSGSAPSGSVFIGNTDPTGEVHEHIESTLTGTGTNNPADGIYLVPLKLSGTGLTDSQTFYALYNNGGLDDSVVQQALEFTRDTFAPGSVIAPEPAALATILLPAGLLFRRRRPGRTD